jgi:hypothetical protein
MPDLDGKCFIRALINGRQVLLPVDIHAQEWLESLPVNREILITGRRVRNPKFHRWFFAMLRKVVRGTDRWGDEDELREALFLDIGHYKIAREMDGRIRRVPKSIAWGRMDEDAFRALVDRCKEAIAVHTGIDPDDLMREVNEEQGSIEKEPA